MLTYYRLARGAGHSIIGSLAWALFNRKLPDQSAEIQRQIDETIERIAKRDPRLARQFDDLRSPPNSN